MNYVTAMVQLPLVRETGKESIRIPADVARVCSDIANLAQETFHVLLLNAQNYIINRQMVTVGLADASLVHPREVFRPAIESGAASVLLVHNHPSGETKPSMEDIRITRQLLEASEIIGIAIRDHVIVGKSGFHSMRDSGDWKFS